MSDTTWIEPSSPAPNPEHNLLWGRYQLTRPLTLNNARTWLGKDKLTGDTVVIKLLNAGLIA